ncbi:hypothetical protein [Micrococcus luteus]|uniref:hypothetical protein n=1 Tax=Micrococcus luteus TaxID=1270 RepID=UPI00366F85DA
MPENIDTIENRHILHRTREFIATLDADHLDRLARGLTGDQENALHALLIACDERFLAGELDHAHARARGFVED